MKKRIILLLLFFAAITFIPQKVYAEDLQLTSGETVRITLSNPIVTYDITSSTGIESMSVDVSSIVLTLASGDSVRVENSLGYNITNNLNIETSCSGTTSFISFSNTVTITGQSSQVKCLSTGGGGGASAPSSYGIAINGGESTTTGRGVTLALSANYASDMKISNLATLSDGVWETFVETKSWTLTEGLGEKRVYVQYRSPVGVESNIVSAVITLVEPPPPPPPPVQPPPTSGGSGSAPTPLIRRPSTPPSQQARRYSDGTLVKAPGRSAVYFMEGGKVRPYLNGKIFLAYGKRFEDVVEDNLSDYETGEFIGLFPDSYDFTCGQLVKASNAKVYIVSKCETGQSKEITWIETEEVFLAGGWSFQNVNYISDQKKIEFLETAPFRALNTHPAGTLVKYANSSRVNLLRTFDGIVKKSWIPTEAAFNDKKFEWSDVVTIPASEQYADGSDVGGTVLGESYKEIFVTYLELGAIGNEVRRLQEKLRELGFFPVDSDSTGYFGTVTENAVKAFQKFHGLEPLGVVGPATRNLLNSL